MGRGEPGAQAAQGARNCNCNGGRGGSAAAGAAPTTTSGRRSARAACRQFLGCGVWGIYVHVHVHVRVCVCVCVYSCVWRHVLGCGVCVQLYLTSLTWHHSRCICKGRVSGFSLRVHTHARMWHALAHAHALLVTLDAPAYVTHT